MCAVDSGLATKEAQLFVPYNRSSFLNMVIVYSQRVLRGTIQSLAKVKSLRELTQVTKILLGLIGWSNLRYIRYLQLKDIFLQFSIIVSISNSQYSHVRFQLGELLFYLPLMTLLVTLKLDGAAVAGGLLPLGKFVPTNPLRTRVLSLVTQDTALFHTILAQGGLDMMTWRGEPFFDPSTRSAARGRELGTVFCLKHKTEAIRIINERINDPILCTSDETILAVSHLAGYEVGIPAPLDSFSIFLIAAKDVGLRNESKRPLA
jgi:hypothetical protein